MFDEFGNAVYDENSDWSVILQQANDMFQPSAPVNLGRETIRESPQDAEDVAMSVREENPVQQACDAEQVGAIEAGEAAGSAGSDAEDLAPLSDLVV